ncbi:YtxH domain-containing protein [Patescibacteria group bacterium]|nr:YtxH domain-containing protein [Patescibacteria group bacterium]
MCTDGNSKSANAVSFGLGTLVGVGAGMLLSTKKGRKMVKQAWKQVQPYVEEVVDNAKDELAEVRSKASKEVDATVSKVKDFADEKLPPKMRKTVKRKFFKRT